MGSVANPRVGVIGSSGYAGQLLAQLIQNHPYLTYQNVNAREAANLSIEAKEQLGCCDFLALALPREPAIEWINVATNEGVGKILDLSDSQRCVEGVHYGLPELFGSPPKGATLVANPGCYPTATLIGLQPLLKAGVIEGEGIAVVGASGATGAGKALSERLHFSNLHDNFFPYKVGQHRHTPEIEKHLGAPVSFVTELLPIARGLMTTSFVRPKAKVQDLLNVLKSAYENHPFVQVCDKADANLGLRHVVGSHQARIGLGPDERSGLVPVFASIDNLMRGAASQAIHNLNLWLGLDPSLGIPLPPPQMQDIPLPTPGIQSWKG